MTADEVRCAVADVVWNRLSDRDKRFLVAMLADASTSAVADVAGAGATAPLPEHVTQASARLGADHLGGPRPVRFADPAVRQYVAHRAAAEGFTQQPKRTRPPRQGAASSSAG